MPWIGITPVKWRDRAGIFILGARMQRFDNVVNVVEDLLTDQAAAEVILNNIECSVLAVRPNGFVSPIEPA